MRPDKKKTRHHDSQKCANKAKLKAAEKARKAPNKSEKAIKGLEEGANNSGTRDSEVHDSGVHAVDGRDVSDSSYSKRQVTSNWTKYEIPSSDEEEGAVTGPDFHFVLENSSKVSDRLQLKAEREWENKLELAINAGIGHFPNLLRIFIHNFNSVLGVCQFVCHSITDTAFIPDD